MAYCVVSGDIVSSTSLTQMEREDLIKSLENLIQNLSIHHAVYGRILKGDYLECVIPEPGKALRVALIIKSYIKYLAATVQGVPAEKNRIKYYKTHGIRLAVGYGNLSNFNKERDIIDGEAIYLSGREISGESTFNKERLIIKNSLFFASNHPELNETFTPLFELLDVLLTKATARQCEVLYLKLQNFSEEQIAQKLEIGQSAVNQHSTALGWNAIESAVNYFDNHLSKFSYGNH